MSDETHEAAEQLFDTGQPEVADDATVTEETNDLNSETEQEQDGLELKEVKTPSDKAEEKKLAIIRSLQEKVDAGKLDPDKLPSAQAWVRQYLKTEENKVDHEAIAREIAKEVIKEEREESQFSDLRNKLNDMKLTAQQKKLIEEKFKLFRGEKISRFKALNLAAEFADVDFTGITEKKLRMMIPKPGTKKPAGEIDEDAMTFQEIVDNYPPEKVAAYLKSKLW